MSYTQQMVHEIVLKQRAFFRTGVTLDVNWRLEQLKKLKQAVMDSQAELTDKERQVILMYYYEDLTLKEISNVLEVSESRVSQLHTKALGKMRGKMGKYMGILVNG